MKPIIRDSDVLEMKQELLETLVSEIDRAQDHHYAKHAEQCRSEIKDLKVEIKILENKIHSSYDGKERRKA